MSQLSKTNALLENLPENNRQAIAGLIDLKTEGDVERVLNKLDSFDARLDVLEIKMEQKFELIDERFKLVDNQFRIIYWLFGGVGAALFAILGKLFFG